MKIRVHSVSGGTMLADFDRDDFCTDDPAGFTHLLTADAATDLIHAERYRDGCRPTWMTMCEACAARLGQTPL